MKFKHQAKALKEIRLEMGLTQREMGQKMGFGGQVISNVERGMCGFPKNSLNKINLPTNKIKMFNAIVCDFETELSISFKL
jgi:transcriptional regulator with XRE-family HTH domain